VIDAAPKNALSDVCFMWWDVFPGGLSSLREEEFDAVDEAFIGVMIECLGIEHLACQESALHGLGHFGGPWVKRAQAAIDAWLAGHGGSPLRGYALAAREGNVL
jgi:hypothetical protein